MQRRHILEKVAFEFTIMPADVVHDRAPRSTEIVCASGLRCRVVVVGLAFEVYWQSSNALGELIWNGGIDDLSPLPQVLRGVILERSGIVAFLMRRLGDSHAALQGGDSNARVTSPNGTPVFVLDVP
jgi:hypothetical protein